MSDRIFSSMKDLKVGKYVIIDDAPCRVVGIHVSKPGKHGEAKMRVEAIGILDGQKRSLLRPTGADVEVPIVERKRAQVVSVSGNSAQLMDLTSYETFDISVPPEIQLEPGKEVIYVEVMGARQLAKS